MRDFLFCFQCHCEEGALPDEAISRLKLSQMKIGDCFAKNARNDIDAAEVTKFSGFPTIPRFAQRDGTSSSIHGFPTTQEWGQR